MRGRQQWQRKEKQVSKRKRRKIHIKEMIEKNIQQNLIK